MPSPPPPGPLDEVHYRPRIRTRTVYHDSPTTVYSAPTTVYPPSATDSAFHNGLWAGRLEGIVIAGGVYYLYQSDRKPDLEGREDMREGEILYETELADTMTLMEALKAEYAITDPLVSAIHQPWSGRYKGTSAEDDDGDQDVVTHLNFRDNGTVEGWGKDSVDGYYIIKDGVWSMTGGTETMRPSGRVAWIEKYDSGFEVALRGQIRADGIIRALWSSTVGVSGSVELIPGEAHNS